MRRYFFCTTYKAIGILISNTFKCFLWYNMTPQNTRSHLNQRGKQFCGSVVHVASMQKTNVDHVLNDYDSTDLRLLVLHTTTVTDNIGQTALCTTAHITYHTYRLRSTGSAAYVLPRTRTKFGERGFFYSGPAAWNTLPSDLHDITDKSTFRK